VNGSTSASWQANKEDAVAPLPAPPKSGQSLADVLPYLLKLALSEKQLSWRLGAAFVCMLVSKAAGEMWRHTALHDVYCMVAQCRVLCSSSRTKQCK
jgi:hypothetical protein